MTHTNLNCSNLYTNMSRQRALDQIAEAQRMMQQEALSTPPAPTAPRPAPACMQACAANVIPEETAVYAVTGAIGGALAMVPTGAPPLILSGALGGAILGASGTIGVQAVQAERCMKKCESDAMKEAAMNRDPWFEQNYKLIKDDGLPHEYSVKSPIPGTIYVPRDPSRRPSLLTSAPAQSSHVPPPQASHIPRGYIPRNTPAHMHGDAGRDRFLRGSWR
jgi:hypothetical protein